MRRLAAAYHDKQQGEAALAAMARQLESIAPEPSAIAAPRRCWGAM
jgi:ATP-binding cassette subfamily C protein CydD